MKSSKPCRFGRNERHRHKTRWWIKEKYWPSAGPNRWVFTGIIKGEEGQIKMVRLLSADSIRIGRHTKIRAKANPYDPAWEPYFLQMLHERKPEFLNGWMKEVHESHRKKLVSFVNGIDRDYDAVRAGLTYR